MNHKEKFIYEKGQDKIFLVRHKRRGLNCGNCCLVERDCVKFKCNVKYDCGEGWQRFKFKEITEEQYLGKRWGSKMDDTPRKHPRYTKFPVKEQYGGVR